MKKAYVKPEVYFESFELSANIATLCGKPIHYAKGMCKDGLGDFAEFLFDGGSCKLDPDQAGLCYHNPSDVERLFNS